MAWDDNKDAGDLIRSNEWDTMVSDQKGHASRHESGGVDEIDHDLLLNFVANEHIDHSTVSISAGTHLTGGGDITASRTLNVDETGIEVDNLAGNNGTSGQFLQTDGTNLSFSDVSTKEINQLIANQAIIRDRLARHDFIENLSDLAFQGGFYDIFRNTSKVDSSSDVNFSTLEQGDNNGKVELAENAAAGIESVTYDSKSIDLSANSSSPQAAGVVVRSNGTSVYVADRGDNVIHQYDLSTAGDVSTASHVGSFDVSGQTTNFFGIYLGNDGQTVLLNDNGSDRLLEYSLSTAYDITSASFTNAFDISTDISTPLGLTAKRDGTEVYISDFSDNVVHQYSLSTAWDTSTASLTNTFDTSSEISNNALNAVWIRSDGAKMVINDSGSSSDVFHQYTLSTAWDISTASYDSVSQDLQSEGSSTTRAADFFENGSNSKMLKASDGSLVFQYSAFNSGGTNFLTSGFFIESEDLSSGDDDFSNPPKSIVVNQDADIPADEDIQYVVSDVNGTGTDTTVAQSQVGDFVDISDFTGFVVEVKTEFTSSDGNDTPVQRSQDFYFEES